MSLTHRPYEQGSKYPEDVIHADAESYGPYPSPPSDCDSIPLSCFFKVALATIAAIFAVATLVWAVLYTHSLALKEREK